MRSSTKTPLQYLLLVLLIVSLEAKAAESVWVEGESATSKSVSHNGWYESVKKDELSGGGWIAHWGDAPGSATYKIEIPSAAVYTLWLRANPVGTKLNVRFDGGGWYNVNFKRNQHETINVASDGKPDLRFVGWVRTGVKKFTAGAHEVEVRFNSGNNNHGCLGSNGTVQDSDPLWVLSDAPLPCYVFTDGFESGDTSAWSSTVP